MNIDKGNNNGGRGGMGQLGQSKGWSGWVQDWVPYCG